ncbi:MAG: hypothetical protein J7497_05720, partial [Chitinophagaceae bacterium]|nr:hypothetical protein [Chitinophagaceae bacterium]
TGQPPLPFEAFPFKGLINDGSVSPAQLKFHSAEEAEKEISNDNKDVVFTDGEYFLKVPGITIGDNFEAIDIDGKPSCNLYIMAVSYISGYNPDYSGLDFCSEASRRVAASILSEISLV